MDNRLFNFYKSIKILSNINNRIRRIIDNHKPKTETKYVAKSIILDFYLNRENISKLTKKYHPQRLDKVLKNIQNTANQLEKLNIIMRKKSNIQNIQNTEKTIAEKLKLNLNS